MARAADREFQLPHLGYDESLANYDLPSDLTGPTKKIHQELNKEIANPSPYEQLSSDIRVERELEPHEFPLAFRNFPLYSGPSQNRSSDAQLPAHSGTKKMWLPAPPTDYVLLPPTRPVGIISIECDEPTPTAAMIPQAESDNPPPTTIFVEDSDVELPEMQTTSPPPMTVYIDDSDNEEIGPPNSVCLEATLVESDAAIPFADIFVPLEDNDNRGDDMFKSFAQTFIPSDNEDGDAMFEDFVQTFIPGSDDVEDDKVEWHTVQADWVLLWQLILPPLMTVGWVIRFLNPSDECCLGIIEGCRVCDVTNEWARQHHKGSPENENYDENGAALYMSDP
ncbi:hypothetical protein BYT27DRAFT_7212730 [Phlegmacium glaucopus]|nr:hypothetical protein BYT27DRAFT_7212730 [Phlegmacium glaucopus]